jgi:hypothetical protein
MTGDPVVLEFNGKLLTPTGAHLTGMKDLDEFCRGMDIRLKRSGGSKSQKDFLARFRTKHFPLKKRKAPGKKAAPKKELTDEEKLERKVLEVMRRDYTFQETGSRGGRKALIFTLEDKHGKDAEAVYQGNGQFGPVIPPEASSRVLARNRWAADQYHDRYGIALAEVLG